MPSPKGVKHREWTKEEVRLLESVARENQGYLSHQIHLFPGRKVQDLRAKAIRLGLTPSLLRRPFGVFQPLPITATQAAYIAGLVDGEGHIAIHRVRSGVSPKLRIANTNKAVMRWLLATTGLGTVCASEPSKDRLALYSWQVGSLLEIGRVLTTIRPYLVIKKEQCRVLLHYLECKRPRFPDRVLDDLVVNRLERLHLAKGGSKRSPKYG